MPVLYRKREQDGKYGSLEKFGDGETEQERVDRLEIETALLSYQDMIRKAENESVIAQMSNISFSLMIKGVI